MSVSINFTIQCNTEPENNLKERDNTESEAEAKEPPEVGDEVEERHPLVDLVLWT